MGGPIDTRVNETAVNKLAETKGIEWFHQHVITKVPFPHPGMMRDVYPGFLQLTGFMSMNLDRHLEAHRNLFSHLVKGDGDSAQKHREFYDEYLAVMDLSAEFYLQTVDTVFISHALPKGEMTHRGRLIDCSKISRVALMTVEGEHDDISGVGQTEATHALCPNIPAEDKVHYLQLGVGHYGVFNGSRFRSEISRASPISRCRIMAASAAARSAHWSRLRRKAQAKVTASAVGLTGRCGALPAAGLVAHSEHHLVVFRLTDVLAAARLVFPPHQRAVGHHRRVRQRALCRAASPQPAGAALYLRIQSATREVVLTMPPRGSLKQAREFAHKHGAWIAARLKRLPQPVPFAMARCCRCAARIIASSIGRSARGTVWIEAGDRASAVRGRRGAACVAPGSRFSEKGSQARPGSGEQAFGGGARRRPQAGVDPRPVEPLGFVFDHRRVVLFLAVDPGATFRARLSRRP